MNQLCKVCGEPAAGFHFGAFTCEGCKSFFGRTYNNISAIAGCKNSGDCVINKKNRTACKACRLRKCLLVGMSKSGSRYGRRSNWFKIHCLLQEQQTQQPSGPSMSIGSGGSNLEQLARLHQIQARQTYQDKTNPCIKTAANMSPTALSLPALATTHTATHTATPSPTQQDFFNAAKFFNGVGASQRHAITVKSDARLSDTPSDSGASSAGDPADDCTSNVSGLQRRQSNEGNCNSAQRSDAAEDDEADERDRRRKQFLQIFRSQSEPLRSPFASFTYSNLPPPILAAAATPPSHVLPTLQEELKRVSETVTAEAAASALQLQEEPIDLSLKSREQCGSQTPRSRSNGSSNPTPTPHESHELPQVIAKPTPLDLTLVRSQTLTG